MDELFALMEEMTDEQLERVQRAEKWVTGKWSEVDGSRCLVGHADNMAAGAFPTYWGFLESAPLDVKLAMAFDRVCGPPEYIGTAPALRRALGHSRAVSEANRMIARRQATPVGRECSAKAAEILAARRVQQPMAVR